jgi:hypothetical protein
MKIEDSGLHQRKNKADNGRFRQPKNAKKAVAQIFLINLISFTQHCYK